MFKKLFYSMSGFAGSAAICYPKEANQLLLEAVEEGKRLSSIAKNFVQGGW
jgi:hypothetical protein